MDISKFDREVNAFSDIDPEMQLNTMRTFLFVAQRGQCNQKDLEVALGMSNATASRSVSYWTTHKKYGVTGVGFIDRLEDPTDRRYKILSLTEKGLDFYNRMREANYGNPKRNPVAS